MGGCNVKSDRGKQVTKVYKIKVNRLQVLSESTRNNYVDNNVSLGPDDNHHC